MIFSTSVPAAELETVSYFVFLNEGRVFRGALLLFTKPASVMLSATLTSWGSFLCCFLSQLLFLSFPPDFLLGTSLQHLDSLDPGHVPGRSVFMEEDCWMLGGWLGTWPFVGDA